MPRNTYDDAQGVATIEWRPGHPGEFFGLVLVEVWTPDLRIGVFTNRNRPEVAVRAAVEVWSRVDDEGGTRRIRYDGAIEAIANPRRVDVRRWADLPTRWWCGTIKLEGWG